MKRTKAINTSKVIRELWVNRSISRVEIARILGLNKSTITHIINELIKWGFVKEESEGEASPQGGRKPVNLSINKKFGSVLGVEVRPESYTVISVDLEGIIQFSRTIDGKVNAGNLKETMLSVIEEALAELKRQGTNCLGIGFGMSGVIDPFKGIINFSIPLQLYDNFCLYENISSKLSYPVYVDNDANCCCWGELTFHRGLDLRNFLFILVEFRNINKQEKDLEKTAVGIGIVIDGKVHYGKDFSAGEFRSVLKKAPSKGQFNLSTEDVFQIETDPEVLEMFVRELAKNIALLVNVFNLSQVFLGGDIEGHQELVNRILREEIEQNWPYPSTVDCEIFFSSLGDKSVAYGAAAMVFDRLFSIPDQLLESAEKRFEQENILHQIY